MYFISFYVLKTILSNADIPFQGFIKFYRINKNLPSRQELFAEYVIQLLPSDKVCKRLEVGSGRTARVYRLLAEKDHHMTCMDPELQIDSSREDYDEKKQEAGCMGVVWISGRYRPGAHETKVQEAISACRRCSDSIIGIGVWRNGLTYRQAYTRINL